MKIQWPWTLLLASTPVRFESAYGLDESVQRLAAATRRTVFGALTAEQAVGRVTVRSVSLQRVIPFVQNSFKPFFRGRFELSAGQVQLVGRFAVHPFVKVFSAIWFCFVAAFLAMVCWQGIAGHVHDPVLVLIPLGMLAFAWGLILFSRWLARNDVAWLSRRIEQALSEPPP